MNANFTNTVVDHATRPQCAALRMEASLWLWREHPMPLLNERTLVSQFYVQHETAAPPRSFVNHSLQTKRSYTVLLPGPKKYIFPIWEVLPKQIATRYRHIIGPTLVEICPARNSARLRSSFASSSATTFEIFPDLGGDTSSHSRGTRCNFDAVSVTGR